MKRLQNNKNGIIQSQKLLYGKLRKLNQLFKIHFSFLFFFFLFCILNIILWSILFITGQLKFELTQIYGMFGTIVTFFQILVLFLLLIYIGIQIFFYALFIFRGVNSLK